MHVVESTCILTLMLKKLIMMKYIFYSTPYSRAVGLRSRETLMRDSSPLICDWRWTKDSYPSGLGGLYASTAIFSCKLLNVEARCQVRPSSAYWEFDSIFTLTDYPLRDSLHKLTSEVKLPKQNNYIIKYIFIHIIMYYFL